MSGKIARIAKGMAKLFNEGEKKMDPIIRYKKHTDVQETWREHGWTSPAENPVIVAKWKFYQTIGTRDIEADEEELLKHQARR